MSQREEHIKSILQRLPESPGSDQYFDEHATVIYVGKAKNLKRRVSSYFNRDHDSRKTAILVSKIWDIHYTVVKTEAEALLSRYDNHDAEWHFLWGTLCYRRGWMDEARRYYRMAVQMDPSNAEYRQALRYMEQGTRATTYTPSGYPSGTESC